MSRSSDHKARQRKKRQQQKQQAIRMHSGSPYRQAARTGELVACYVNEGWKEDGLATIFVLRRTTAQGLVMAAFFVDIWCAGLKDAWGWLNATMDEFRDRILQPPGGRPYNLKRVDLAVARRLVAGGIRFAERNGFRLPPRLQRWTAMLGDLGAINEADLSDFGVDGKLRWMGSEAADLRRRLVGCSVRDFVQRNDVECLFSMDDFLQEEGDDEDEDDDDEQFVREVAERTSAALAQAVRRWCFATGQPPQPRLEEAAEFFFQLLLALRESPDDEPPPDMEDDAITPDEAAETDDLFEQVLSIYEDEQQRREVRAAISQVRDFLSEYDDPEELFASLDLGDLPEDGERSDRRDRV